MFKLKDYHHMVVSMAMGEAQFISLLNGFLVEHLHLNRLSSVYLNWMMTGGTGYPPVDWMESSRSGCRSRPPVPVPAWLPWDLPNLRSARETPRDISQGWCDIAWRKLQHRSKAPFLCIQKARLLELQSNFAKYGAARMDSCGFWWWISS